MELSPNLEARREYYNQMKLLYDRGAMDKKTEQNLRRLGIIFDTKQYPNENKRVEKDGRMKISERYDNMLFVKDSEWKPKSVVNHTDDFYNWINSFTFSKFSDMTFYKEYELYKKQADIWMKEFINPYDCDGLEERRNIILKELDRIERNTLYFAMQYYEVPDGSVRSGRFKYVPKEHNAIIFYLLDCGYLFVLGKPRQIFATTTVGIFIWKKLITQENFFMTFISEDEKTAKGILQDKIKNSFRYFPKYIVPFELDRDWQMGLKCGKGKRKGDMGVPNSRIEGLPPTKTAINSSAPQVVFVDEAASVPDLIPMVMEQRPTLYMDLKQDGNLQIRRQILLWSTGTTSTKGKMAYHALWENLVKLWNEKKFKSCLFVPVFFSWETRCDKKTYEEARESYFEGSLEDLQGYSVEERKQIFHMHYPSTWTDMFAMVTNKVVPTDIIQKNKSRIRAMKASDRPIYGRFEPIYDFANPLDDVFGIPYKILGAKFIPHDDTNEDYEKISVIMRHRPEQWENRYSQGTDPIQTDTGQSMFSSVIWDNHLKTPACILNYRPSYNPRDAYLQTILMSIYYDPNPIGAKTGVSELIESNIGIPYYSYKELIGYNHNVIYNKELPQELHGGGSMWGVDTKNKRKEYMVTNGLKECIITYADNIDYDIVFSQLDTYVPVKTGQGYSYQPADKRLYKDDVLDALSMAYIASKLFTEQPYNTKDTGKMKKVIRYRPHHDQYGNYTLQSYTEQVYIKKEEVEDEI